VGVEYFQDAGRRNLRLSSMGFVLAESEEVS
jgi:hypothetical protein